MKRPAALPNLFRACCVYLTAVLIGNLIWEVLQLPFYTIWHTGTLWQQAFAVVHCVAGDLLIAATALGVALITVGHRDWPSVSFTRVAVVATAIGLGYTVFSEQLNVSARHTWAYSELMPLVSLGGLSIGLSPLLQWSIIPVLSLVLARRRIRLWHASNAPSQLEQP